MAKIKLFLTKYDKYPFQKRTHLYIQFSQLLEMIEIFRKKDDDRADVEVMGKDVL